MSEELEQKSHSEIIASTRDKLKAQGFDGLFYDGACACDLDDLAPCGNCGLEDLEDFINGCEGGYKHFDPRPEHAVHADWAIWRKKEAPTAEQWENLSYD